MVECGALEKRCASKRRTGSSNLPPSAYSPQAPPPWRRTGPWRAAPYQRPLTPLSGYHYRIAPIPQGLWPLQCGFCGTGASCGASSQFLAQPCGFASVSETVSGVKPLTGVRIPPSVSAGCEIVARLTSASRLVVATVFGPARPGAQSVCDWCRTWPAEPMLISRDRDWVGTDPVRRACHEGSHLPEATDSEVGAKLSLESRNQPRGRLVEKLHTIWHHDEYWTMLIKRRLCE